MFSVLNAGLPAASQSPSTVSLATSPSQITVFSIAGHSWRGTLGRSSAVVNTTLAPESLRMYFTSSDLNMELTETTMAPTFSPAR